MSKSNIMSKSNQFNQFDFGHLSDSEIELVELLVKHQHGFSKMDELKRFLNKLFFNESNSKRV
jgi:hypothetical protein